MTLTDLSGHIGVPPPNHALSNNSPNPAGQALSSIASWWNAQPPLTKVAVVVVVAAVVGVATFGVADVAVGGVVAGEAVAESGVTAATVSTTVEGAGLDFTDILAAKAVVSAGTGASVNTLAALADDAATGRNPTWTQIGESAAAGAAGGTISVGLTAALTVGPSTSIGASVIGYAAGGAEASIIDRKDALLGATGGSVEGVYSSYGPQLEAYSNIWSWAWGTLSGL